MNHSNIKDTPAITRRILLLTEQSQLSAAEHPELNPSTLLLLLSFYKAFSVLDRNQAKELAQIGLSRPQFNALAVLHRARRHVSMGELAGMMAIQQTNLSGVVKALRTGGLVEQNLDHADQRSRFVSITEKGTELLGRVFPTHWKQLEDIMSGLSETDRNVLVNLLDRLVQSIEQNEKESVDPLESAEPAKRGKKLQEPPRPSLPRKTGDDG